jgi:hypothetical protein
MGDFVRDCTTQVETGFLLDNNFCFLNTFGHYFAVLGNQTMDLEVKIKHIQICLSNNGKEEILAYYAN